MNTHKHARLTFARRLQMVQQLTFEGFSFAQAAAEHGVTPATARKWLARYLAGGESALEDASSRPARSPRSISPAKALLIVELRHRHLLQARIARAVGVSESTVSRVLARAGLSKLSDLKPVEPVQRYEHDAPGDLLHIDTKKLGRIVRPSHRVTQATAVTAWTAPGGRPCSLPSTTTHALPSRRYSPTRRRRRPCGSCAMPRPTTRRWACGSSGC